MAKDLMAMQLALQAKLDVQNLSFETVPSAATGDIFYLNATGDLARLPIGTEGQVLAVSSAGIPEWVTA
jgi:hypothetical protein